MTQERKSTVLARAICATIAGVSLATAAEPPPATCASAEEARAVRAFYAELPSAPPLVARRHMGLAEEVVASGIGAGQAAGVSGAHFRAVWESLAEWPRGFFIMDQHGWVMKFEAPVPALLGNQRKDEFTDVKAPGEDGLVSHFRPDLVTSIHAVALPGGLGRDGKLREGMTRAVIFYDASRESVFGIYASLAGESLPADPVPAFEKTMALMRSLPQVCPR